MSASVEDGNLATGTAKLQGRGKTGKAASDDDDVIHGDEFRVEDVRRCASSGAPCTFMKLSGIVIK
ncbi:hypothetical protein TUM17561_09180 [Enterobacter cloacae]|nr:hypothetical protein TUM17561_09180 [Enterobacter cloacae]